MDEKLSEAERKLIDKAVRKFYLKCGWNISQHTLMAAILAFIVLMAIPVLHLNLIVDILAFICIAIFITRRVERHLLYDLLELSEYVDKIINK